MGYFHHRRKELQKLMRLPVQCAPWKVQRAINPKYTLKHRRGKRGSNRVCQRVINPTFFIVSRLFPNTASLFGLDTEVRAVSDPCIRPHPRPWRPSKAFFRRNVLASKTPVGRIRADGASCEIIPQAGSERISPGTTQPLTLEILSISHCLRAVP